MCKHHYPLKRRTSLVTSDLNILTNEKTSNYDTNEDIKEYKYTTATKTR